ncbi:MAG: hypothetical protein FWF92_11380 [Oscillospiraceae bacterium]|nr:hypothetical protein [Oscillospiraceae bacterium]
MPKEYEFMKSSKEKEMPDDEYKTLRDEYDKKAEIISGRVKKLVFTFLAVYALSFIALYIFCSASGLGSYMWLAAGFLLAIFLYDPKAEEDKKHKYETDKKILLNSIKSKINMNKIKLGLVIFFGLIFIGLNIYCWWAVYIEIANSPSSYSVILL